MDVHPAISKKLDESYARAKELVAEHQEVLGLISKVVEGRDGYGLKSLSSQVMAFAIKLQVISAQVEALRSLPYDMVAEEMAPRRRQSGMMAAVTTPEKKPET